MIDVVYGLPRYESSVEILRRAVQATHWFSGGHFYLTAKPAELAAHVADWLRPQGDVESHVPQPSVGMSRTQ